MAEIDSSVPPQASNQLSLQLPVLQPNPEYARSPTTVREDRTNENALLRASLASIASQLQAEQAKNTELSGKLADEEQKVLTLRVTLEESRRALMRLQSESAKKLPAPPSTPTDTATKRRSGILPNFTLPAESTTSTGQRAGHRRMFSYSGDPDKATRLKELRLSISSANAFAESKSAPLDDHDARSLAPRSAARLSISSAAISIEEESVERSTIPWNPDENRLSPPSSKRSSYIRPDEHLHREIQALKMKLDESEERRIASEQCAQSLREFIANSNNVEPVRLPPLPSSDSPETPKATPPSRWSILGLRKITTKQPISPSSVEHAPSGYSALTSSAPESRSADVASIPMTNSPSSDSRSSDGETPSLSDSTSSRADSAFVPSPPPQSPQLTPINEKEVVTINLAEERIAA